MTHAVRPSVKALAWMLGSQWTARLVGLAATIALARLLTPADFGLVAIATSYLTLVEGLTTFNVGQALIRLRTEDRELLDTAWTLGAARGALLGCVMMGSGGFVADFAGDPELHLVIRMLAIVPVISGLANPRFVIYERRVDFSRIAVVEVVSKILSSVCVIAYAIAFRSYWAIVAGSLMGAAVRVVLTYAMIPYRPQASLSEARRIFSFGGWLTLANAINTVNYALDNLIVARMLGVKDAGVYQMTRQIAALPTTELLAPLQRVLFPSFTTIADDAANLRDNVLETVESIGSFVVPIAIGIALVAPELVPLVFGDQWSHGIPLVQIILPFFAAGLVLTIVHPAAMAVGATREIFITAMSFGMIRMPVFAFSASCCGLIGIMYGLALLSIGWWVCNFLLLQKVVTVRLTRLVFAVHRPLIAIALMVGLVLTLPRALAILNFELRPLPLLGIKIAVGAISYIGGGLALWLMEGRPAGVERRAIGFLFSFACRT